jgi:Transposase DDE domain
VEHQLWMAIVAVLATLDNAPKPADFDFSDEDIVKVHYWAVLHDRPIRWACQRRNWPLAQRRRRLPSEATMSRRLRSRSVLQVQKELERRVLAPKRPGLFWIIDGKPFCIGGCSKDRQAGFGRAANSMAKGYKVHAILDFEGSVAAWRVAPMNKDERVMAERLVREAPIQGYLAADSNYDSNKLHQVCDELSRERNPLHLVTRRRFGAGRGTGHRKQTAGRLHSMQLTENPYPTFAEGMLRDRGSIERRFGHWTNWGGGLTCLPAWVRTHRRVHRWVQAKLVLTGLKRSLPETTCVA